MKTMKKQLLTVVVSALFLMLTAVTSEAQQMRLMRANIPFDFNVGNTKLPAGHYAIQRSGAGGVLQLVSLDGKKSIFFSTLEAQNAKPQNRAQLEFRRYGSERFLSQVRQWGDTRYEIRKSKREREVAKKVDRHLAMNNEDLEIVMIEGQ
jgi:hypothetical protein